MKLKTIAIILVASIVGLSTAGYFVYKNNNDDFIEQAVFGQVDNIPILDLTLKKDMTCDQVIAKLEIRSSN